MSTQHPDNIASPFFADSEILAGEAEVKEAYFVFSQVGATEQMWDSEGKEVDNQVIEKLISRYSDFFSKKKLGKDCFLTFRVPNPSVEKEQGKILLEALYSIPRAFDSARAAGYDNPPVFEVILPMTTDHSQIEMVRSYYEKIIVGQKDIKIGPQKTSVKDWVGEFKPDTIDVIPLFENLESLSNIDQIVGEYIQKKNLEYMRVFLARSDPAMNYGSASAVLLAKIALHKLGRIEEKEGLPIFPIIGVGGAPFRGNFTPNNVNNCGEEYPSVQTFTAQSSFKFDHPFRDVANAVDMINHRRKRPALDIDEKRAMELIKKIAKTYEMELMRVAEIINGISAFVPNKRARKLHVGLFGYSRSVKGMKLPRAIKFCASFYSIGIPPELLGLSALSENEFDELHTHYTSIDEDLKDSAKYINKANLEKMPNELKKGITKVLEWVDYEEDEEYSTITSRIYNNYMSNKHNLLAEDVKSAAWKRKFLG